MTLISNIIPVISGYLSKDTPVLIKETLEDLLKAMDQDLTEQGWEDVSEEVEELFTKLTHILDGTWKNEDEIRLIETEEEVEEEEELEDPYKDFDESDSDEIEDDSLTGEAEE